MSDTLINHILAYMDDTDAHYAIALEGEWGSGKTRFCEGELCKALLACKEHYTMLRVSLLGVADVGDLYARIAMAFVHLGSNDSDGRGKKLIKAFGGLVLEGGISVGKTALDQRGVNVSISPQLLSSVLGKNQLLVLDDFERSCFDKQRIQELFGAVNSLVEGQGCKVMFVTNDFLNMDGELREKLVWRCYRFNPSPKELANSIIVDKLPKNAYELGFDANKCVLSAVESANCMNARAMIKASALISMAFESNAACDSEVDGENREAALRDFVSLALLAAMGRAPKRPAEREPGMPFDYEHARELELFNRYMSLDVIESYFNVMDAVSREAVDICLARYIMHRYSGSPDTMSVARVLQRMRDVQGMDDKEVAELATELSDCILHTRFDASYIGEAVRTNWTLRSWGFEESVDSETVRARVQFLADEDPEGTYRGIHREYIAWQEDWADRYDGLMADLDAYVVEVYETRKREENKRLVRCGDPDAGRCLADVVQKGWSHGEDLFVEFAPKTVADCFACGNAASQKAIYAMSMGFESRAVFFHNAEAMEWARSLCEELRAVDPKSRMGRVRRRWTVEAIERLLKIGVAV